MANPKHVELAKEGWERIRDYNEWVGWGLDLSDAHLDGEFLSEADLRLANLTRAHLYEADLSETDLENANLSGADLRGADLSGADLSGADLSGADLSGADLSKAGLIGAAVHSATFSRTTLGDTDLSGATGLERVQHDGPSVIDERTLRRSWPLPEVFLRGCGLSNQLIEYLPSLFSQAIEFYSCFISYSSRDDEFAKRLHADLQDNGVRCWFAPEDLKIGDRTRLRIDESIKLHDKLLLILTEHSVASDWVAAEVETALAKESRARERSEERTVLFPIRLDAAVMESDGGWAALVRNTRNIGDFTRWKEHDAYQRAFERLLRDLKAGAKEGDDGQS